MLTAVTGASGHIGANLVRALLKQGRRVRVLVHEDRKALAGLDTELIKGDIFNRQSLMELLEGVQTVFHLACRISLTGDRQGLVYKTNVGGTENVIEACLEHKVKRLIHFSSIGAFANNPGREITDETSELALDKKHIAYDRSKATAHLAIQNGIKKGLDAVIVCPTAVIGPNDFKVSRMGDVLLDIYHNRLTALIDGGFNWVDVRDIVEGSLAAEEKGRNGECYILAGHWVHLCELSAFISRLTGNKTPTAATPVWLAHLASYGNLLITKWSRKTPKFTPEAVKRIRSHRFVSHQKASAELGYHPRPFEETVRETFDWFRKAGMLVD